MILANRTADEISRATTDGLVVLAEMGQDDRMDVLRRARLRVHVLRMANRPPHSKRAPELNARTAEALR
jgi:hypothetical protein